MCDMELKHCDLIEFSKMYAPEYNMPEFSDRILVFDVMRDDWEMSGLISSSGSGEIDTKCSNGSVKTINGKRNVQIIDEEPEQKRRKVESGDETLQAVHFECDRAEIFESKHFVDQAKTGNEIGSEVENKSDEPTCEQAGDVPVVNPSMPTAMQENLNKPLRQHKIYVHGLRLAVQSPYFRSLLHSSGMKETHCTEVHLKILESEESAHLILLEAMYRSDVLNDKTVDELLAVLELADKYDVKFVFKKCKYVLQKNATTFDISTQIMHVIKVKHNMNDVEDLAATLQLVLAQEFSPLDHNWQSEKFSNLSEPSVKYLLSSDDLIVQSENTVFQALMHWMEQNDVDPAGLEETNDLLAVVRFKLVTIDYLYNVIKNHPIASKMPRFMKLCFAGMTYHAIPQEQKTLLKDQPALRKKPEMAICQYMFEVKKQNFYSSRENRELNLDDFWACGYKMSVDCSYQSSYGFGSSYKILAHLSVHNLNEESLVPLRFSIAKTRGYHHTGQEIFSANSFRKQHDCISLSSSDFNNAENTIKFFVVVNLL